MLKKEKPHQYILPNGLPWYSAYWRMDKLKLVIIAIASFLLGVATSSILLRLLLL